MIGALIGMAGGAIVLWITHSNACLFSYLGGMIAVFAIVALAARR